MNEHKKSIYLTLSIIIITTVTIIMSIHSAYNYTQTKNKLIVDMKDNSRTTIISLKNNLKSLVASYAVNEYDNLILNEIKRKDIFAIIVDDYNMGKILGKKGYLSGKIRNEQLNIVNYDPLNTSQKKQLDNCYYSDSFLITASSGRHLGKVSIYISDNAINQELQKIIKETIINTLTISLLLILLLFIMIRLFILKPISDIINVISHSDKDGIPLHSIEKNGFTEINNLSQTINKMISTIKDSRQILKKSEHQLEYLLEMSPIAVRIAKNKGQSVIFANQAYSKLLRINKDETLDKNPQKYYVNQTVYKNIVEALNTNRSIYNELVKLEIENRVVWALASYMNITFDGEEAVIGWFYDVTKEKENEVKLFQALELQTTIFDHSGYILLRTDKKGTLIQINKEAQKLLGYTSEELIRIHTPAFFHLKSEVKQRAKDFSKDLGRDIQPNFEVFIAKTDAGIQNEHEWTYITKEGKQVPVLLSITALKNKDNETYGYLGIAQDITQRRFIESQAKLASMGEMIGNIAHQWRQPLSAISTIASGIKVRHEYQELSIPDILPDMDNVIQQTGYLSKTIDDFRNFIKDTKNKESLSIKNTTDKALSILHSALVNNNITLISHLKEDVTIEGFENQLIQAIINIINNAKDALKEQIETQDRFIFIETKKRDNNLILEIKDSAGGIKEDIIHKVFEPYFTTKHQSIGTGIGLSITYQIISAHENANIEVTNETYSYNDKSYTGACFQIIFNTSK